MAQSKSSAGGGSASDSAGQTGPNATPRGGVCTSALGSLSFVRPAYDERGQREGLDWFAVPDEDYSTGWLTGMRAAKELLQFAAATRTPLRSGIFDVMATAGAIAETLRISSHRGADRRDRYGAAVGFLRAIESLLGAIARSTGHQEYLAAEIESTERSSREWEALVAAEKAAFVSRMREGREAKRRAREASHA